MHNNLRLGLPRSLGKAAIDEEEALRRALQALAPTGRAIGAFEAKLYVAMFGSGPRVAYRVTIPVEEPLGDWVVWVDAQSAAIHGIHDQMVYATGSGRVFDPDPLAASNNQSLPDNNDSDSGIPFPDSYFDRTLLDITDNAGTFELGGPYCIIQEIESPTSAPATETDPDAFFYTRSQQEFEDVNVYFHIDQSQRYIQSLGFNNANNRQQPCDPHGLNGADNSHYVISTRILAWGEGGVDDAEDADVVLHEYGHALQHDIVPNWGGGQEGAMGEGFGDYWAGSYSYEQFPTFQDNFVFNWDGHNEFWPGRLLIDTSKHYPEDCCGQVHSSGTLWCSGLTDAMRQIGRNTMDALVIDHHFALGGSATMADAANQIIQSDIDMNGGANVQTLVTVFDFWGFVDASTFVPQISHMPLSDTEDEVGPYPVLATITSAQPLDPSSLKVFYGVGSFTDSLVLSPTANPNEYSADIPGPFSNVTVQYYITASDSSGGTATHPAGAPGSFHSFFVGADVMPPVIAHAPLNDQAFVRWPANVDANITDNLGVDDGSVVVDWSLNSVAQTSFALTRIGATDDFTGTFNSDTTMVSIGDMVEYAISASDNATSPNTATDPAAGTHSFEIVDTLGLVLILDDDDVAKQTSVKKIPVGDEWLEVSGHSQPDADVGKSATDMESVLNAAGYVATVESATGSDPGTWGSYDLLVSSSGGNEGPVADATYRTNVENYVAGGGKLIVEGGEVVYDAAVSPGYASFAANVLHSTDWDADDAGSLGLVSGQESHPIATIPNTLPTTLAINYTGFGSQESYKPDAPAYIVYDVASAAGNGGILVYDDNPAPQSAQIVVFGFDFKDLDDSNAAAQLLENTAAYLLAPESGADASISGTITVSQAPDNSGVTVTLNPGGSQQITGVDGSYSFASLFAQSYTVTATKDDYTEASSGSLPLSGGEDLTGVDMTIYPQPSVNLCVSPGQAIPNFNPSGITSDIVVADDFALESVEVYVDITHPSVSELTVEISRGGTTVRLHDRSAGPANIIGTYPSELTEDGPGSLADFQGQQSAGTWTLFVSDSAGFASGTLNEWCVTLTGEADSSTTTDIEPGEEGLPSIVSLTPQHRNPVVSGSMSIRFGIPHSNEVGLKIYDVGGRLVRTLVDQPMTPGFHTVQWDGLDAKRQPVASGVYFYRLSVSETTRSQKVVFLR